MGCDVCHRAATQTRKLSRHPGHQGRRVGFASVGNWRQVGAVGLYEQPVQRHKTRHVAQILGIFEGQYPGKRDIKAHVQRRTRHLGGFGKAVKHPACAVRRAVFPSLAQQGQGIGRGTAGVDDQGLCQAPRGLDVHPEAVALPGHVGHTAPSKPVIVEPAFAHRHHPGQTPQAQQIIQAGLRHALVVGVNSHGCPKIIVLQGQFMNLGEFFQRGANAQGPVDLRLRHGQADGGHLLAQLRKAEVAV